MIAEAYIKDGIVAIVHFRKGGKVYGHTQREEEEYVPYAYLFRMDEDAFTESLRGAEAYDVERLPALYSAASSTPE